MIPKNDGLILHLLSECKGMFRRQIIVSLPTINESSIQSSLKRLKTFELISTEECKGKGGPVFVSITKKGKEVYCSLDKAGLV